MCLRHQGREIQLGKLELEGSKVTILVMVANGNMYHRLIGQHLLATSASVMKMRTKILKLVKTCSRFSRFPKLKNIIKITSCA